MKPTRGRRNHDGAEPAPVATNLGVKPLKTGVGYSLYADSETNNFVLAEQDIESKKIQASFTSSINFIDHVITKINETTKHAEKIKLLALYQQLYSIDEFDYEYIQKRTGIITDYRQVDLESFRNQIKNHEFFTKFTEMEPKNKSKDQWKRTKTAIMYQYTCMELNKHFNKTLNNDVLKDYIYFNSESDLCEIVLLTNPTKSLKTNDGTHGFYADKDMKGVVVFKAEDFSEKSLRQVIEDSKTEKIASQRSYFEYWTQLLKSYMKKKDVSESKDDSTYVDVTSRGGDILVGYYTVEKNGYFKLYGEYYNLWAYIDYHLNNSLISHVEGLKKPDGTSYSMREFWIASSLKEVTKDDFTTMKENMKEQAKKIEELSKTIAGKSGEDATAADKRIPSGSDGFSWKRSPDGRNAKKALRDGKITRQEYKSIRANAKAKAKRA